MKKSYKMCQKSVDEHQTEQWFAVISFDASDASVSALRRFHDSSSGWLTAAGMRVWSSDVGTKHTPLTQGEKPHTAAFILKANLLTSPPKTRQKET